MPRQANRTPYTKTLTALLKPDLVRLCNEFHLPNDGSVVVLRNRLKDYLNLHQDNIFRNPQYNALFPKHRRVRAADPPPPSTISNHSSSPFSDRSSDNSFASWNGIDDQDLPQQPDIQHYNPPFVPNDLPDHDTPPPSPFPSPAASERNSPIPTVHPIDSRELPLHFYSRPLTRALFALMYERFLALILCNCQPRTLCSPFRTLCSSYSLLRHYEVSGVL